MTQATTPLRILMLEDSPTDAELIERELRKGGMTFTLKQVESREAFTRALEDFLPDIILTDFNLPGFSGMSALEMVRRDYPETPVIMVTGALSDKEAVELLQAGAQDYVLKDRLARLPSAVQHVLLVEQGIKIRKLAEAQLHEKTELLENVINSSTDYIFVKDRELRTILCNETFARALGKKPEELYGKTDIENGWDADLVKGNPEKGIRGFEQDDLAALAGNKVHSSSDLGNIGEEIRYFDSVKVPLKSSNGEVFGMLGISRDVTEQKQIELRDQALLRRNQVLMQSTSEGVHILDDRGNVIEANEAFCRHLGYTQAEILQLGLLDFDAKFSADELRENIKKLLDGHAVIETVHRCKNGELVDVEVNVSGVELDGQPCLFCLSHDITERKRAEDLLRFHSNILQNLAEGVFLIRASDGVIVFTNPQFECMFGYETGELLGKHVSIVNAPGERSPETVAAAIMNELARAGMWNGEVQNIRKDGTPFWCRANVSTFDHPQFGKVWVSAHEDISERKRTEEDFQRFFNLIPDLMCIASTDGHFKRINPMWHEALGYTEQEILAQPFLDLIHPDDRDATMREVERQLAGEATIQFTNRYRCKDGNYKWLEWRATPAVDKKLLFASARDITQKKEFDEIIWRQANFDALTSLPNRHMLHDRMEQEIKKSTRSGASFALLLIDLDHFKEVNDTLGHDMGDVLLTEATHRIVDCVRATDVVARMGGDEFTVLLTEVDDFSSVERIAQSIIQKLAASFQLKKEIAYVSASIGITLYPNDATDIEGLLKNADQAMYVAKEQGRNRHSYFTPALHEAAQTKLRLVNDLRGALAANQFMVYFQPIVELATGNIRKAEALIRWQHPERGLVNPAQFIPLAEETGLILGIGDWVFHESMRYAKRWRTLYNPVFQISVNKSPIQFYKDGEEHTAWLSYLREIDLPGQCLTIEITEGLLLDSNSLINGALLTLRNADIQVSIDDFGTGYSSLSYLKKFDIDYLKIDRSFVSHLAIGHNDLALCEAIIVMAHKLDIKVIAEGVETAEQRDLLAAAGCDYAQGYLYSKPIPADEFEKLLKQGCWQGIEPE